MVVLPPRGHVAVPGTFCVVTAGAVLLALGGRRPGLWPNTLQLAGRREQGPPSPRAAAPRRGPGLQWLSGCRGQISSEHIWSRVTQHKSPAGRSEGEELKRSFSEGHCGRHGCLGQEPESAGLLGPGPPSLASPGWRPHSGASAGCGRQAAAQPACASRWTVDAATVWNRFEPGPAEPLEFRKWTETLMSPPGSAEALRILSGCLRFQQ